MNVYRSKGYRAYVIIGLLVCVAVPIGLAFGPYEDEPGSKVPAYAAIGVVGVWVAGLLVWQLRGVERGPIEFAEPEARALGPADPPLGWKALSAQLAVEKADATGLQLASERTKSGLASQIKHAMALMVCIIGGMIAFLSGAPAWVFAPAMLVVIFLVARVPSVMSAVKSSADVYLRPLGLRLISTPRSEVGWDLARGTAKHQVVGPTTFGGKRHGREVRIDLESRTYKTRVNGKFASLDISSDDGKLAAGDKSPSPVRELVEFLSADERWKNVSARSRGDGITVERKRVGSGDAALALWLDDLWLAEQLAERSAKS